MNNYIFWVVFFEFVLVLAVTIASYIVGKGSSKRMKLSSPLRIRTQNGRIWDFGRAREDGSRTLRALGPIETQPRYPYQTARLIGFGYATSSGGDFKIKTSIPRDPAGFLLKIEAPDGTLWDLGQITSIEPGEY